MQQIFMATRERVEKIEIYRDLKSETLATRIGADKARPGLYL